MPNGWGSQKMYNIRMEFQEEGGVSGGYFMLEDKIAFRTVELVEEDMSGMITYICYVYLKSWS